MNQTVEHLINEYMTKLRDEYFKTEDKSKEIIEFLNSNFSDYIKSIHHELNTDSVNIYFKHNMEISLFPRTIEWFKIDNDKFIYKFHYGKKVENIADLIPEICELISRIKFAEEIAEYRKAKMAKQPKISIWKFWTWTWN